MNLLAFRKRLAALETRPRPEALRPTEAELRADLRRLASDAEAAQLHNAALVETAKLRCPHIRHGWCRRCVDATPTVGAAWQAVAVRMAELESLHNPHTKEYHQ